MRWRHLFLFLAVAFAGAGALAGQSAGRLRGTVSLEGSNSPLHHATVVISRTGLRAETDDDGTYEFPEVPRGRYEVVAHMHSFSDVARDVEIIPGQDAILDFKLALAPIRQQVTVTASGREQTSLETYQAITSLDTLELAKKGAQSLGEVLENEPGLAKRSFGPGTARPVIRGFDGDRVLILQDGMRTGTLSSQSGDHGEPIDATGLERLEVVRGPATLLYGSSAIGGVVNAITGHHQIHQHPHKGLRGYLTANLGSANSQAGGSAGVEYGWRNWLFWGDAGEHKTGDYMTPIGRIPNSRTRTNRGYGGLGSYGQKFATNISYGFENGRYGVPFAASFEEDGGNDPVDLEFRRHNLRGNFGVKEFSAPLERFDLALNYSDWHHRELKAGEVGTRFYNKQFTYRGIFEQHAAGRLSGSFGFSGMQRSYKALGEETLSPPVDQTAGALFALEEVQLERARIQLGGRLEHNNFSPTGLQARSFTGFSGAAGANIPLWSNAVFALNYAHSYRAPALEELYNRGPHTGNLTFEVGNPNLKRERGNSFDIAIRHEATRIRAEANAFHYLLDSFVYLAPTGRIEDGLIEADYLQSNARYRGGETLLDVLLAPGIWLKTGFDYVDARLRESNIPLPRIPPLRGRIGVDARYKQFSVHPELVLSNAQRHIFTTETPTAGYAVVNLDAAYTVTSQHAVQVFGVTLFNASDRLYRNHLSFIKELAPEIGRGVRFNYTIRFF